MILCFSGTGNSLHIAKSLATRLNDKVIELKDELLTAPEHAVLDCKDELRAVWVFPVYSWGIPPALKRFMECATLRNGSGLGHYMVATCGDDAGLTHRQWRKLMKRRGWSDIGAFTVIMPNTYTLMKGFDVDTADVASAKLAKAAERVKEIAADIDNQSIVDKIKTGKWARIKSGIIYPWFVKNAMSPKPFHTTDACTGCGLCARACPMENVMMWKHRPSWGERCALCLRCYHICPNHAVAYGKSTERKGQYLCPEISVKEFAAPEPSDR